MTECPCKRIKCERHGKCEECHNHHAIKKSPPYCEKLAKKEERQKRKQKKLLLVLFIKICNNKR